MVEAILFTQCLQGDFVGPIGRYDPVPNPLHVGFYEAARLLGDNPAASPLNAFMKWSYAQNPERMAIFNIRDFHDPQDEKQKSHLAHFGPHAIGGTKGAAFIFDVPPELQARPVHTINGLTLNDFEGTNLAEQLEPFRGQKMKVGIAGAWTEAKVLFLAYELATRYPEFEIAVCSALTASSSRARHFEALDMMKRILGMQIVESVEDFTRFLGGEALEMVRHHNAQVLVEGPVDAFEADAVKLIQYLFRDCNRVSVKAVSGGYSGNYVLATQSGDAYRRPQVPHVLKIGPRKAMLRERDAFQRVENVLGNAAPSIVDFAEMGAFGAIKYRYASMDDRQSTTLQKIYRGGAALPQIFDILDKVFLRQLSRFSLASNMESCNLLDYYGFEAKLAPAVARLVAAVYGRPLENGELEFPGGVRVADPTAFYAEVLPGVGANFRENHYYSFVHGDLNGQNILQDANKNVWLIDFFHTHYGHALKDLIKLENDVQFLFTPVENDDDLKVAMAFTDSLLKVKDLASLPSFPASVLAHPQFGRAARTVRKLRSYYPAIIGLDMDPLQLMIGQLRYAAHSLSFEECTPAQKKWALYATAKLARSVGDRLSYVRDLQIADIPLPEARAGTLGLTILPGRRDRNRDLIRDIGQLKAKGVNRIYALITDAELQEYGVPDLIRRYEENGIAAQQIHIPDGAPPSHEQAQALVAQMERDLQEGKNVVVHCLGGLGRSGTAVASYLVACQGLKADEAIAATRQARSSRAIETRRQERFIHSMEKARPARTGKTTRSEDSYREGPKA